MESFFVMLLFISVIAINFVWLAIKATVNDQGYQTNLFWGHWQDIINLHKLVVVEKNKNQRYKFIFLLSLFYAALIGIPIIFLCSFLFFVLKPFE